MKHFFSGMILTLALVMAIVIGVVALAETVEPEVALPSIEEQAPVEEAPTEEAPAEEGTAATDSAALREALDALNAARQSEKAEALESELAGYVASGKLTQAQADLILNYYNERQSLRNGVCPGCGYQFQDNGGFGRGGRGNGGNGGKGGRGMRGGMRGFGQQPQQGQGGQANGTAYIDGMQGATDAPGFGDI